MFTKYIWLSIVQIWIVFGEESPVITTPLGTVSGVYDISYDGRIFSAFYGIPYAEPPVGELRFQEPQKVSPWNGIWKANNTELACVQLDHVPKVPRGLYLGDEDCLYLNVFFPGKQAQNENLLDVVVFIHGGAFMFGSMNTYGPNFLMDRDVVLVTINYRLGVFGFLSTEDDVVPGNNGLKDQVMALKWIQSYIKYFGGNPDSVTLTGLSAGAASVHFHYLSPLSKGLFHRGVSMSGTVLGASKMQENALEKARMIGEHLGCTRKCVHDMVKCMKRRPTRAIVEAIRILRPWLYYPFSPLAAVVEKEGNNRFLTDQPWHLLATGKFHDLPWLNSVTSEEGLYPGAEFLVKEQYFSEINERWNEIIPHLLDYNYTIPEHQRNAVSETIRKAYLAGEPLSRENFMDFIAMISDRMFGIAAEDATKIQAQNSKSEMFYYYFSYVAEDRETDTEYFTGIKEKLGTAHGDDTLYVYSIPKEGEQTLSENDKKIKDIFLDMWTNFAKSNVPSINNIEWPAVSKNPEEPLMQLHIRSPKDIFMEDSNRIERHRRMWKEFPFEENENLFNASRHDEL